MGVTASLSGMHTHCVSSSSTGLHAALANVPHQGFIALPCDAVVSSLSPAASQLLQF